MWDDTARFLTGHKSGDSKVKVKKMLTVYHDTRIGKAVPFSLLAWADDQSSRK